MALAPGASSRCWTGGLRSARSTRACALPRCESDRSASHAPASSDQRGQRFIGAAIAVAAAALVNAQPADAGLVITEQPKTKMVFQQQPVVQQPGGGGGLSFSLAPSLGLLAVPLTAAGIGAGAVAASRLDAGFDAFLDESACKDSNILGVGYETKPVLGKLDDGAAGKKGKKLGLFS